MNANASIMMREAELSDLDFVMDTVSKSLRNSPMFKLCSNDVFYEGFKEHIEPLIMESQIVVACNPEDPSQIYGYVSYYKTGSHNTGKIVSTTVNYMYIKQVYRGMTIGSQLLNVIWHKDTFLLYKYSTPSWEKFIKRHTSKAYFSPFANRSKETI